MRYLPPRWLLFTCGTVVLVLAALTSVATVAVREPFPQTNGEVVMTSLKQPATVVRDEHGIPEIRASNAEDLFAAQGFVHAQERFFEMDVRRHITSGRLAELFGDSQLETDAVVRTLGWRQVAEQEVAELPTETRRYLDAYAMGVNNYLESRRSDTLALEYTVLGAQGLDYTPEPWSAVDTVAWLKAMAWDLDGNLDSEVLRAVMNEEVGVDRAAELFPEKRPDEFAPVVQHGRVVDGEFQIGAGGGGDTAATDPAESERRVESLLATQRAVDSIPALIAADAGADVGSNSWAISGDKTASGKPILANDPHLATSVPSTFMQMRLTCTTVGPECPYDVGGYSFSGMPGIIIGHNQNIAWGLTVPYVDTQDLYLEEITDGQARRAGTDEEVVTRTETLHSSSGATHTIEVRSTSNGPLISDAGLAEDARRPYGPGIPVEEPYPVDADEAPPPPPVPPRPTVPAGETEPAVALKSAALEPGTSMEAIFGLNRASNWNEFRDAAAKLTSPSQNLMYADVEGNIGYQLPGWIPERVSGDGTVPVEAWQADAGWEGYIPFTELPRAFNPPEGYLVAANQQIIDQPAPVQADASYGFRSQPIVEALAARDDWDVAGSVALHGNSEVRWAADLVPALVAAQPLEPWVADGQQVLADWDRQADADSAGMAFFSVVMRQVVERTFGDEIPADLGPGQGSDQYYAALQELIDEPTNAWWDDVTTPQKESRDQILSEALLAARKEITAIQARDPEQWNWGSLHQIGLRHQTLGSSGIGPVEAIFNTDRQPVDGGTAVVEAWGWSSTADTFDVANGPTMRMTVDFANFDDSMWVNQSGTSGHTFHPHYSDQLDLIVANEPYPWLWSEAALEGREDVDTLELQATP